MPAFLPCDSAIPAWSSLQYNSEDLALEIAGIIWGWVPLLFDENTELLWDDGATVVLWG